MAAEWAVFAAVAAAHALAVASPGPDFAMVVRQSLAQGRAAGVWTAAGIGSGILFHVGYGLFGLAWVVREVPELLRIVGYAGAAFLIWMGLRALRAQPPQDADAGAEIETAGAPAGRQFLIGLLTNVLNPKAALFFVALFSAVITAPPSPALRLALAAWLPLTTFAWFALVATLFSNRRLRERLRRSAWLIDRAMGAILIALGVLMLLY